MAAITTQIGEETSLGEINANSGELLFEVIAFIIHFVATYELSIVDITTIAAQTAYAAVAPKPALAIVNATAGALFAIPSAEKSGQPGLSQPQAMH